MRRTETPKLIWIKFSMVVDIPDIVTNTNFGDHWLRGFWLAGGQIFPFPIDFDRRPYLTTMRVCDNVVSSTNLCVSSRGLRSEIICSTFEVQCGKSTSLRTSAVRHLEHLKQIT